MTLEALQELLLRYHRAPYLFKDFQNATVSLPEGLVEVFRLATVNDSRELREAAVAFVCSVLLIPGGSAYRSLCLNKNAHNAEIDEHYNVIASLLAKAEFASALECHLQRLQDVYTVLKDSSRRASNNESAETFLDEFTPTANAVNHGQETGAPTSSSLKLELLDFQANPSKYAQWTNAKGALPQGIITLCEELSSAPTPSADAATPIPDVALLNAVLFFITRVLIIGDHYRTLALTPAATSADIQHHYRCLRRLCQMQTDSGATRHAIARISAAYVTLRDPFKRALYDDAVLQPAKKMPNAEEVLKHLVMPEIIDTAHNPNPAFKSKHFGRYSIATVLMAAVIGSALFLYDRERELNLTSPFARSGQTIGIKDPEPIIDASNEPLAPVQTNSPLVERKSTDKHQTIATVSAPPTNLAIIQRLLAKAERELNNLRLTSPPGDNAVATYSEVLAQDSRNRKAREGLQRVAEKYLVLARKDYNDNDLTRSLKNVAKGLTVVPNHEALVKLQHTIELRQSAQMRLTQEAELAAFPTNEPTVVNQEPQLHVGTAVQLVPAPTAAPLDVPVEPPKLEAAVRQNIEPTLLATTNNAPELRSNEISREELDLLAKRFVDAYETGDLSQFTNLFAVDARANNRNSLAGIVEDYRTLFETTDTRLMTLKALQWNRTSKLAIGEAQFQLAIKQKGDGERNLYDGNITLEVEKQAGKLRITGLYHSQRRGR